MIRHAALGKERLGGLQVIPADLECVVALAERVSHLLEIGGGAIGPEEQRTRGLARAHDDLVGQPHLDRHAEHLTVEALGAAEVGDVHAEMVETPEPHDGVSPPAPSLASAHAAAPRTPASSSPSARVSAPTAPRSPRFARTIAALRTSPARFVRVMA